MENDDALVGQVLSRREVLVLIGGAGAAFLAACSGSGSKSASPTTGTSIAPTSAAMAAASAKSGAAAMPSCVVRPALTEGPYFVDEKLNRSDIRSDPSDGAISEGTPLALAFAVSSVGNNGCEPLAGATVDVWHCDALGVYSDASDPSFNTKGKKFLRGYQVTDAGGSARFLTIYPGWYQGRAVHIHFKIRTAASGGQSTEFTSQLFFDESITDVVHSDAPYAQKGERTLRNEGDSIYQQSGGQLTLAPLKTAYGYASLFDIGLQL